MAMKKVYFSLLVALLVTCSALANTVIVKGYVTYSNGTPVPNHTVVISDSSNGGSCQYHTRITNQNGFYIDTLQCSSNITHVRIGTDNCGGITYLFDVITVPPAGVVEKNFTLSCMPPSACQANYSFAIGAAGAVQFTNSSVAGTSAISYFWSFGDGTSSTQQNPVHTFTNGTYNVCLKIGSTAGCYDSTCKIITITNASNTNCVSNFSFQKANTAPLTVYFNSANSYGTGINDAIISRYWTFGDGTNSTGNVVSPTHTYTAQGTYTVCLKITTASGCEKTECKSVAVYDSSCHANYSFNISTSGAVYFTNTSSTLNITTAGYLWTFGDGTSSNVINPVHTFNAGTYTVCLKIGSGSGCYDSVCKTITIAPTTNTPCEAVFSFATLPTVPPAGVAFQFYSGNSHATSAAGDSITERIWHWGDGGTTTGNVVNPIHTYLTGAGTYNVCLIIRSASGCRDTTCKSLTIYPPATNCEAVFSFQGASPTSTGFLYYFTSSGSHATSAAGDSIRERVWKWGDGTSTTGNLVSTSHTYTAAGTYNVCLIIRTVSGCSDTTCKTITITAPTSCVAYFTYEHLPSTSTSVRAVRFNSSMSVAGPGDSIIYRKWMFGDGSTLTGNDVSPLHQYAQPGTYTVCLIIRTKLNCEKTICKTVVIPQVVQGCVPHFTWQRTTSPKTVAFNSISSWVPAGDSIVQRKWNFGDATPILGGNVIAPTHTYLNFGVYSVSLRIITAQNCEKTFYGYVNVQDSINNNPTIEPVKIISLYPNPASIQTQTVVWSLHNNVSAELAIYDIYGSKKWSINKILLQGNNVTVLPTGFLAPGPYYFRVTTMYGVKSKAFFKF
jgi:PKD repeat protein